MREFIFLQAGMHAHLLFQIVQQLVALTRDASPVCLRKKPR